MNLSGDMLMLREKLAAIYKEYTRDKYLKTIVDASKKSGLDVNDYIEGGADNMAQRAIKKLFQGHCLKLDSGAILEVGAGTGRFTREIKNYIHQNVKIMCLENLAYAVRLFKKYIKRKGWANVNAVLGDYFNYDFENMTFEMVIIPWFIQLSLY